MDMLDRNISSHLLKVIELAVGKAGATMHFTQLPNSGAFLCLKQAEEQKQGKKENNEGYSEAEHEPQKIAWDIWK